MDGDPFGAEHHRRRQREPQGRHAPQSGGDTLPQRGMIPAGIKLRGQYGDRHRKAGDADGLDDRIGGQDELIEPQHFRPRQPRHGDPVEKPEELARHAYAGEHQRGTKQGGPAGHWHHHHTERSLHFIVPPRIYAKMF